MARFLTNELPDARLEFYGMMGQSNRWGAHYHAVLARARMGLNYSRPNNVSLYASDRMAHIMGNGLMALTAQATGFQKFFTESEMVYYGDDRDLADKIRYYKNNDSAARAIAESGWRKSHREFNGTLVAQYIYERSMGLELSHSYLWADEFIH
jgi:spore maturation protein CgeB